MKFNHQQISNFKGLIDNHLYDLYKDGPISLTEPIHYVLSNSGKRLRPILTLLTTEACGGNIDIAIPLALSVEILHNFTLVHDDIMDEDHFRHGQLTVHEKWDIGGAILTGDAMLALAMKMLQKHDKHPHDLMSIFTEGLLKVCEGQALDKEFESRNDIPLNEYIRMIDMKTGHLLGLSSELGAISAGIDTNNRELLRNFGRLLGRAFQIQDDILELYSHSDEMGKSLESDIILGKNTYPMLLAMNEIPEDIKDAISLAHHDFPKEIKKIRILMTESGIQNKIKAEIKNIISQAEKLLELININTNDLKCFSDIILNRKN